MRAFVPQGYMAERSVEGSITVTVCGSGHMLRIPTGKSDAPDKERAQPPCAFAGLGTATVPPPVLADLGIPTPSEQLFVTGEPASLRLTDPLPRPPARGPPLTA